MQIVFPLFSLGRRFDVARHLTYATPILLTIQCSHIYKLEDGEGEARVLWLVEISKF